MSRKLTQLPDQMPEQPPVYEGDDYSVVGGDPSFDTDSFDTGEPAISEWEDSADETDGTLDSDSDDRVIDDTAVAKNSLEPFIARHKNKRQIKKDQKLMSLFQNSVLNTSVQNKIF